MSDIRNCYARQLEECLKLQHDIKQEIIKQLRFMHQTSDKARRAELRAIINKLRFQWRKVDGLLRQIDEEAANVPW